MWSINKILSFQSCVAHGLQAILGKNINSRLRLLWQHLSRFKDIFHWCSLLQVLGFAPTLWRHGEIQHLVSWYVNTQWSWWSKIHSLWLERLILVQLFKANLLKICPSNACPYPIQVILEAKATKPVQQSELACLWVWHHMRHNLDVRKSPVCLLRQDWSTWLSCYRLWMIQRCPAIGYQI